MNAINEIKGLVTVVIPTFNRRAYVGAAIDSVLAQTYDSVEVIVVDDGSTDGTYDEVRTRYQGESRVRYLWQENAERAVARNTGIRAASGEYVAFLDSDDLWLPDKLGKQVPLIEKNPTIGFVFSGFDWIDDVGTRSRNPVLQDKIGTTQGDIFESLMIANVVGSLTVLTRRALLVSVGLFNTDRRLIPFAEDWELWLRLAYGRKVAYVPESLALHRVHGGNSAGMVGAVPYRVMMCKLLAYVAEHDRQLVYRRAERYLWNLVDEAVWRKDRCQAWEGWLAGTAIIGPRFLWHGIKYRWCCSR